MPLGLGKPNHLINALYEKVRRNPQFQLDIYTALSLLPPEPGSGLKARLLQPFLARQYAHYPGLDYETDRRRGNLPGNVRVFEFFMQSGSYLDNPTAQQHYISSNYTHALRDLLNSDINILLQMVAVSDASALKLSLSSNPDLSLDLMQVLDQNRVAGQPVLLACEVNRQMPFLPGSAVVPTNTFDLLLDDESLAAPLFAVPNEPVDLTHYAIATQISSLIKDGGTLQIGIGSLGDAVAHLLSLRHHQPAQVQRLFQRLASAQKIEYLGPNLEPEMVPFEQGLYGMSEMLVQGFLYLRSNGVLTRTVTDPVSGLEHYAHAGFYLGSKGLYDSLESLGRSGDTGLDMTRISFINQLYGDEDQKRRQRRHARFINSAMMVTLGGAVVSDGLEDGRVISGVGGQYNFVAMAQELQDARSIIALPSTRIRDGITQSNIVYSYGQTTIPRHLRDIVVTEYGAADLRGQPDNIVMARLLAISDSRFQPELLAKAKRHGKLPKNYAVPACFQNNRPQILHKAFDSQTRKVLPRYPLGTDFRQDEAALMPAFQMIKSLGSSRREMWRLIWQGFKQGRAGDFTELLTRLDLESCTSATQWLWRCLVLGALTSTETHQPLFANDEQLK